MGWSSCDSPETGSPQWLQNITVIFKISDITFKQFHTKEPQAQFSLSNKLKKIKNSCPGLTSVTDDKTANTT